MWIGGDVPIEVQRNATLAFGGQVIDATTDEPVDLTGYTIDCDVAAVAGGTVLASPTATIDAPTEGGFSVTIDGSDFDAVEGDMEPVRLAYNIRLTSGSSVHAIMRGPLTLLPGVG